MRDLWSLHSHAGAAWRELAAGAGRMTTSLPRVARIVSMTDESRTVRTLILDRRMEAGPGQFVMVWLPGIDEKPFSLVRADPVTLTVARVGPFTRHLFALGVGDRVWLRGPLGRGFTLPPHPPDDAGDALLLVGGGYGVAPLHFLAERAIGAGWPVWVVIGARTAEDVLFRDRFEALGARVVVATDDGSLGERGLATDAAAGLLEGGACRAVYACGPEPMLAAVDAMVRSRALPAQLSHEQLMRCGFGVCGTCAREGWLVCSDGPVRHLRPGP